ncbi:MAG: hypothetical protein M1814_001736 [Vezdaea aestivalis]|nr:MAG: hypothetical protein M1814_001736 [Vezdaea aestivalis]
MADEEPNARLLPGPENDEQGEELESVNEAVHALEEKSLRSLGPFIWTLTLSAGLSGLLFGYDTGVISSTLVTIGSDLSGRQLSTFDKSIITSCTSLFALISSPISGILADRFGRKKVILIADTLFIGGALWQALSGTVWSMVGGRSLVGLAIGSASLVTPLYISELAPSTFRGRLVTVAVLNITLGQVISYLLGYLFSTHHSGWRWMVGLGGVPALIQIFLLFPLPESPRWLVMKKDTDSAQRVLDRVYGKGHEVQPMIETVLRSIVLSNQEQEAARRHRSVRSVPPKYSNWRSWHSWLDEGWIELFRVPASRRALAMACFLQGLQQLCGFNSVMYFSATIFASLSFSTPTLTALSVAATNFLFTLLALFLIDYAGRRKVLLYSIPGMVIGLLITSLSYLFFQPPSASDIPSAPQPSTSALSILASLTLYVAAYALGLGNVPWQQSELFPLTVRSLGSSLATATNWASNFVVGLTFLPLMELLTPSGVFALYAVICAVGWILVRKIYPETKGLSLEEIGGLLETGWGVEESLRRSYG